MLVFEEQRRASRLAFTFTDPVFSAVEAPRGHGDTERGVASDSVTGEGPASVGRDRQEDGGQRTGHTPTQLMARA